MSLILAISIIFHLLHSTKGQTDDDFFKICPPKKCGDEGPLIRFPFRLDSQPRSCYGDGYELSCSGNTTLLNLPWSGNFTVTAIDYLRGTITIKGGDSWSKCPLQGYRSLNFTNSIITPSLRVFSLVGCPRDISWNIPNEIVGPISCLNNDPNQSIYAVSDDVTIDEMPDVCTKISDFHGFPYFFSGCTSACAIDKLMKTSEVELEVFKNHEYCFQCEEKGKFCGLNYMMNKTVCVEVGGNDAEIAKKLAIVALWCVQCNPADRPCMSRVINMLEGDLQSLSMPPNPFA
ncbi:putative receptor-like protein kinase [Acorus gramineus]|uniref:RING-type E3 ubiquitin transferase n=1 Tax=Acorus gramineus TaxID=55184 RepID=A0AAV9BSI9_ACOGR|nr:putative receptor-like protein kinase [Acorus gramineus]